VRVLIYEPDFAGHRMTVVRVLCSAILELAPEDLALATTAAAAASDEFRVQVGGPLRDRVRVVTVPKTDAGGGVVAKSVRRARQLARVVREQRADHCYVPFADGLAQIVGAMRAVGLVRWPVGTAAECLLMRLEHGLRPGLPGRARAVAGALAAGPWDRVHVNSVGAYDRLRAVAPRGLADRVRLMPDPIDAAPRLPVGHAAARRELGLPVGGRLVVLPGTVDRRKGADRLVRAFAAADLLEDDRLLLIGPHRDGLAGIIREAASGLDPGRIVSVDRYVDDHTLNLALAAADVVAVPYVGHTGSVSMAIRAAAAGRLALGSADVPWLADTLPRFGLGRVCDVRDPAAFGAAIRAALDASADFALAEAGRRFVAYASPDNVAAHWTRRLRERLGRPPRKPTHEWAWVCDAAPAAGPAAV